MAGAEDTNGGGSRHEAQPRAEDTLDYLCELISELKLLADRTGQRTLSAILAAALTEARIQTEHGRRRRPSG